jgi:hypothetical protein
VVLDELDVATGGGRKAVATVELRTPALEGLVHRPGRVEIALMLRKLVGPGPVAELVGDADRQPVEERQYVQLGQRDRGDPVQPHGVPEGDEVEPAAAPLAAGDGSELAAEVAHARLVGTFDLGRERPFAYAGEIGLRDAHDRIDARRADSDPRAGAAGDRRRRGDERVGAVVDVEQGSVAAFEQHAAAVSECPVDEERGVGEVRPQPLRVTLVPGGELL